MGPQCRPHHPRGGEGCTFRMFRYSVVGVSRAHIASIVCAPLFRLYFSLLFCDTCAECKSNNRWLESSSVVAIAGQCIVVINCRATSRGSTRLSQDLELRFSDIFLVTFGTDYGPYSVISGKRLRFYRLRQPYALSREQ